MFTLDNSVKQSIQEKKLYTDVLYLSIFTIAYNIIEGIISIFLGYADESLTLFGFGVDSFIEVLSGFGILVMIKRIKENPKSPTTNFEKSALKLTGTAFYILSIGLIAGIIVSLVENHKPETTIGGIIISVISILVMIWLVNAKIKKGKQLKSDAIIADANCTKVCIYMSVILLVSSAIYEITGFAYADIIGTLGIIYYSFTEGKEAFDKAKGKSCGCTGTCEA